MNIKIKLALVTAGLQGQGNELFFQAHGISRVPRHDGFPAK
ncbi:hypothetical protein ACIOVF_10210 [Pseudomonas sp. NPDC087612]|nr:hypothetical protein [Pseudomonas sp. 2(2015)]